MPKTTISYIAYTHTGSGVRHHYGLPSINPAPPPGSPQPKPEADPGTVIQLFGHPFLSFNGTQVPFAFMSVHGAADGNNLYTSPVTLNVTVGNENLDVLVVYANVGGGNGEPGVWVDAFNVDTGQFSDSDFIQVLTPPTPPDTLDNPKTSNANKEGEVSSLTAETLRALANVDGAPFSEWKGIMPIERYVDTREFELSQNETGEIWFAFYHTISPSAAILKLGDEMARLRAKWEHSDRCGYDPQFPWGPHGPHFRLSIEPDIIKSLSPAQRGRLQGYMKEYPAVAKAAHGGMEKVSAILKGVSELLLERKARKGK